MRLFWLTIFFFFFTGPRTSLIPPFCHINTNMMLKVRSRVFIWVLNGQGKGQGKGKQDIGKIGGIGKGGYLSYLLKSNKIHYSRAMLRAAY